MALNLILMCGDESSIIRSPYEMLPRVGEIIDAPFGLFEVTQVHWGISSHPEQGNVVDHSFRIDVKKVD